MNGSDIDAMERNIRLEQYAKVKEYISYHLLSAPNYLLCSVTHTLHNLIHAQVERRGTCCFVHEHT